MSKASTASNLFLVRVWVEEAANAANAANGRPACHGKVQHVVSGEARTFNDGATLEAAMHEILEMLQPDPAPENEEGEQVP
jgi:hypothetical protein